MMTPSKSELLVAQEHHVESVLASLAAERAGTFAHGIIGSPWGMVCRMLEADLLQQGIRATVEDEVVWAALRQAGWLFRGPVAAAQLSRRSVWVAPTSPAAQLPDSELRRHIEKLFPTTLSAVPKAV